VEGSGLRGRGSRLGGARRWRRRRRGSGLVERELLFHAEADLLRGRLRRDGGVERRLVEPDGDVFLGRGCGRGRFLVDERRGEVLPRRQLLVQVQALFIGRRRGLVDRDRDVFFAAERDLLFVAQRELLFHDDGRGRGRRRGTSGSGSGLGRGSGGLRGGTGGPRHVLLRFVLVFLRGGGIAPRAEDLGQGQAMLRRLGGQAFLRVDLAELLARLQVVGETRHHRLELIGGLVDEAVLPEDLALGEVLVDELPVLIAQGSGGLDDRPRGGGGGRRAAARAGAEAGARAAAGGGRGRHRRGLVRRREVELLLHQLRHGSGGRGRGRAGRRSPELALHELELRLVLRVGRLALYEELEHGGGVRELSLLDVGLGELGVGREEARLLRELLVDLDEAVQGLHVGRALLHDLLQERSRAVPVPPLHELLDERLHLLVGAVELVLLEGHPRHLHANVSSFGLISRSA
jgi:hypothetical protein